MDSKRLSHWAAAHPWTARFLIFLIHLILIFGGLATGVWLFFEEAPVVPLIPKVAAVVTLLLFITYPLRRARYWRRKSYDGAFLMLLFVMLTGWYHGELTRTEWQLKHPEARVELIVQQDGGATAERTGFFQKLKRKRNGLRRSMVERKKSYRATRTRNNGGNVVGGVLMILLGVVVLSYAALILACALSCGGFSAGAVTLMILGFLAGVALLVGGVRVLTVAQQRRRQQRREYEYEYEYEYLEEETPPGKN